MKINRLLMVALLLAILTIGAVSASDNLTAESDSISHADDSSENILDESYYDDDFYISVDENYTEDKSNWDSEDLIYISSYSQDNGTFSILVDDVEKQSLTLTNGYFSTEEDGYGGTYNRYVSFIYPNDLGLDLGKYNIKVKYNQKTLIDTAVNLKQKDDFNIFLLNPYNCDADYWQSPSFIIIDSNHANTGTLEILVNGTSKISYALTNGDFEEIADCSNKSRYIAASDLLDTYGTYNIKITFTENGTTKILKDENVIVREFEPTTDPKVELYFDFYRLTLPADNIAHVYLPREATGDLTISFNNVKNQTVSYSKGYGSFYMNSWDMNHLGENTVTVTYTGDDFGTLQKTESFTVIPKIDAPTFVSVGEEFTISVMTHDWVYGTFNVYEYKNSKKGKLLASDTLYSRSSYQWATASVKLASEEVGLNSLYLEFDYYGGDCPQIQDIYVVENTQNVSADVAGEVEFGNDFNVTFTAPAISYNFVYITVDDEASEFFSLATGEVTKTVSGLSRGYHKISVQYNDGNYVDGKLIGDVYSKTFTVNVGVKTQISADNLTKDYGSSDSLSISLKDINGKALANKNVIVNLADSNYTVVTKDDGVASLPVDLPSGNYVAEISFVGDAGYFASSCSAGVVVVKSDTQISAPKLTTTYNDAKNLVVTLRDANGKALSGKPVTVILNGKSYSKTTDSNGQVKISVNLAVKTYTATFSFAGDDSYVESSGSVKVVVSKATPKLTASSKSFKVKTKTKKVTATLKTNKNKVMKNTKVTLKVNGKSYSVKTNSKGVATFKVKLTKKGTFKAVYKYAGSSNYKSVSKTVKITVKK